MASPGGNVIQSSDTPMADPANKVAPLVNLYCPATTSSHRGFPYLPGPNRISTEGASVAGTGVAVSVGGTGVNVAVGGTGVNVAVGGTGVNVAVGRTGVNVLVGGGGEVGAGGGVEDTTLHPNINSITKNRRLT